jgi:hypothetical protein
METIKSGMFCNMAGLVVAICERPADPESVALSMLFDAGVHQLFPEMNALQQAALQLWPTTFCRMEGRECRNCHDNKSIRNHSGMIVARLLPRVPRGLKKKSCSPLLELLPTCCRYGSVSFASQIRVRVGGLW